MNFDRDDLFSRNLRARVVFCVIYRICNKYKLLFLEVGVIAGFSRNTGVIAGFSRNSTHKYGGKPKSEGNSMRRPTCTRHSQIQSMQRSTVTISIKAFKYRESLALPDGQRCMKMNPQTFDAASMWDDNRSYWVFLENVKLQRRGKEENRRNPGFVMFSSEDLDVNNQNDATSLFGPKEGFCPSSGLLVIFFEAKLYRQTFAYRYNTLKIHEDFRKEGSFVETRRLSDEELAKPDVSSLPLHFWKQIGLGDDKLLLKFTRREMPIHLRRSYSDDVTGDLYCYGISRIYYYSREN